jgi:trigger factor
MTVDALREQYRPRAEKQVKIRLALEKIADVEKLEATDEELNLEYEKIAGAYGVELDKVKELIAAEDLKRDIVVGKAMTLVKDNAIIK